MASTYRCKHCDWFQEPDGFYRTSDDLKKIFEHEKTHKKPDETNE